MGDPAGPRQRAAELSASPTGILNKKKETNLILIEPLWSQTLMEPGFEEREGVVGVAGCTVNG